MSNSQIAIGVFQSIMSTNPSLKMDLVLESRDYDVEMSIPMQKGLNFPIHLNLQNVDELHLVVEPFWGEWFPCTDPKKTKEYEMAVNGVLSGKYRFEITRRNGKAVKALLQAPENGAWKTVFTWGRLHFPFGKKSITHVQNQ